MADFSSEILHCPCIEGNWSTPEISLAKDIGAAKPFLPQDSLGIAGKHRTDLLPVNSSIQNPPSYVQLSLQSASLNTVDCQIAQEPLRVSNVPYWQTPGNLHCVYDPPVLLKCCFHYICARFQRSKHPNTSAQHRHTYPFWIFQMLGSNHLVLAHFMWSGFVLSFHTMCFVRICQYNTTLKQMTLRPFPGIDFCLFWLDLFVRWFYLRCSGLCTLLPIANLDWIETMKKEWFLLVQLAKAKCC